MSDRIPSLDGLRAVAVVLVLAHHMGWAWADGGWLGVEAFFVISGYLITSQLLRPRWTFRGFVRRRLARLWPALLAVTGVVFALGTVGSGSLVGPLIAATYVYTPVLFWGATVGPDNYLQHTWSLAVEMHFYLAWGWLMLHARTWPRARLARWCWTGAAASYGLELAVSLTGNTHAAYYATPTRLGAVLIGCGLAARSQTRVLRLLAVPAIPITVAGVALADSTTWWGVAPFGAAAALCTAWAICDAPNGARTVLSHPVMQWVGTRSYSLYLWHVPVFTLVLHHGHLGHAAPAGMWASSFAAAEASYRFVERPARFWLLNHGRPVAATH